ncbi:transglutaminase domain-containing protein [Protaetiibacter mangrovi]|uniref:Transglutaminase domain-containing protein n=1 Tax=Protaetiibacter mangrovi TaxID=2970926 RepID=A0ABT1ZI10_9MICO|nr:transglutaminase domain-containing protein [Protaetiibacter mangrovi]MCS0500347.1 transglutaminase domain-containing protein [Protaetiibacter mangrovi]TPW91776.1 transglutaminase domain-containing protein [Schumannella luteola]
MTAAEAGRATSPAATHGGTAMPSARTWVDVAVLLTLAVLGVLGFAPSYGGYSFLLAGMGGLVLGAATGILTTVFRLGGLLTVAVALVGYVIAGPALAVPSQTIVGVVPTLQSLASVAIGTVYGWADLLTLSTPVGAPAYIAVVPYAASWIVALVSTLLATRWLARRPRSAWRFAIAVLPAFALYLTGILVGTAEAYQAGIRGVVFAVLVLLWLGWRRPVGGVAASAVGTLRTRKIVGSALVVVVAVVLGGGAGFWFSPAQDQRFVLRDEIEPPFDPLDYPSPLAGFRHFTKQATDEDLFTATGLEAGDRIRMATLDAYTGKLWNVTGADASSGGSGSYELVGRSLPAAAFVTPVPHPEVEVTIEGYDDVWVPGVGYPDDFELTGGPSAGLSDELRYNASTGSMVLTTGLREGDSYRLDAVTQEAPGLDQLDDVPVASVELPPVEDVPDIVTAKAQEWAGSAGSPAAQLEAIRQVLVTQGFLSHGRASDSAPSRAGHGADRMSEMLEQPQMIGDEEQYSSLFALMARSLGFPARVVMGFAPEVPEGGGAVTVTGDDVTAWVEVAFDGVGWVPFDPTPDETDIPQDQVPKPQSEPQPQVRQPPRADKEPEDLLTPVELEKQDDDEDDLPFVLPGWVYGVGIGLLALAALVFLPVLIIAGLKGRRMRRRRTGGTADQAAGAWEELADRYSELGYLVPPRHTRSMLATRLEGQFPAGEQQAAPRLRVLATETDELVFSGRVPEEAEADALWTAALRAVDAAHDAATPRTRLLARYRVRAARDLAARLTTTAPRRSDR